MFCTVMAYICCCQWEVIVVMSRLVVCSETLTEKGLCGLRVGLYHFSWTAAIKSSQDANKVLQSGEPCLGHPATAWGKQPLLTITPNRFKSADKDASTQHGSTLQFSPKPRSARRKSFKKSETRGFSRLLSESVCQSTFLPRTFAWNKRNQAVGAAGRGTFDGHKLKLG